ncbi:hypothetical protein [Dyadobacter sp. 3J3]|uniref:hypothetical protein n=1 Tax=Dyadobacter sp. 3J3 TaxID=2606600 RepID=UPI0013588CE1|nr:hypothetical protein [Dyadobacter sp. 3J3]
MLFEQNFEHRVLFAKVLHVSKFEDKSILKLTSTDLKLDRIGAELFIIATEPNGGKHQYIFPVNLVYKRSVKSFYTTFQKVPMDGFEVTIYKEKISSADYKLHLIYFVDGKIEDSYNLGSMLVSQ